MEDMATITVTKEETEKLLDLLGHADTTAPENDMVKMVTSLYRALMAFEKDATLLPWTISKEQLYLLHRYFTPTAFGQGGREFQKKLALAFIEIERIEYLSEEWRSSYQTEAEDDIPFNAEHGKKVTAFMENSDETSS